MNEPTVLDYVKSKLFFWRGEIVEIPWPDDESRGEGLLEIVQDLPLDEEFSHSQPDAINQRERSSIDLIRWVGWWALLPLGLALFAQRAFEPPDRSLNAGLVLYILTAGILVWAQWRGHFLLPEVIKSEYQFDQMTVRSIPLWGGIIFGLLAFLAFGGNRFTQVNLSLWLISLALFFYAFWQIDKNAIPWRDKLRIARNGFSNKGIRFSPWTLLVIGAFALSAFFRLYLLDRVPPEMFSDHAEKLLDVGDVLNGQYSIFFVRNTGREAFQMYLTAAMAKLFGTGLSFLSLKLGTALAGLFTLPFIYLLGKEIANRRVGLLAMALAGIAYWPNVISRVALRFALYPLFAAPTLYFLIRALRRGKRNDYLLAGLFLGLGLHGYSPFRFVPFIVLAAVGLYLVHHRRSKSESQQTLWGLIVLTFSSLLVFIPLLRFALSNMDSFSYRMLTRMTEVEATFSSPVWHIFLKNLWDAMTMFFWDNGEIWVHSVTHRPALGIVSASLFFIGALMLTVRYLRRRGWVDAFLLISIPMLMMPSILSLAFPAENPSLNRTGGALIPVFLIVALALDGLLTTLKRSLNNPVWGARLAWGVGLLLLAWSCAQNYDLVFRQYSNYFALASWNTSELGAVIRQFADSTGDEDSAWVVPYPHWVDTRLVGIKAGFPERDYALWPEQLSETLDDPRVKMFLFKPEDTTALETLRDLYPLGSIQLYDSEIEGKNFYIYFVPPVER
ncbi:MAG: glycosyltransferase family 39 protein [Anaerolineales bacterium]|nr:glycosyltransferase family 39 protein [Chloroflexota bacterium]MBL6981881.1 glycosyltransferase family 39 protein [Anaerolineales bacterium]